MSAPLLTFRAPKRALAACPADAGRDRTAAAELALDMMGRAFEALALLYEIRHPGEYTAQAGKLKEYVADMFRHVEQGQSDEGMDPAEFRDAVLRVRDLFGKVDHEVAAMFPTAPVKAA